MYSKVRFTAMFGVVGGTLDMNNMKVVVVFPDPLARSNLVMYFLKNDVFTLAPTSRTANLR